MDVGSIAFDDLSWLVALTSFAFFSFLGAIIFLLFYFSVWGQYCEDDLRGMIVRGINFMSDKKKIDCGPALFKLMHADIFKTHKEAERAAHFAARKESWAYMRWERQQARAAAAAAGEPLSPIPQQHQATAALANDPLAPLIVINFLIPGSGHNMNLVLYFARRVKTAAQLRKLQSERNGRPYMKTPQSPTHVPHAAEWESDDFPHDIERIAAFDNLLEKFLNGTNAFRDERLKIVPRVAEGSWVVKKSIGRVPAILGKKVNQLYYRDVERNYLEIDADLGTSVIAGRIISMVKGTCKGLTVDMSFLLQGQDKSELPESLLGGIRQIHIDLDKITYLEDNNKTNPPIFDF